MEKVLKAKADKSKGVKEGKEAKKEKKEKKKRSKKGKEGKKEKIKDVYVWMLLLAGTAAVFFACFVLCCYRNYEDKMDILAYMAADYDSGLDMAVGLLRGDEEKQEQLQEEQPQEQLQEQQPQEEQWQEKQPQEEQWQEKQPQEEQWQEEQPQEEQWQEEQPQEQQGQPQEQKQEYSQEQQWQQQQLEQYGYQHSYQNRFYVDFIRQTAAAAVCLGVFTAVLLAGLFLTEKYRRNKLETYLNSLGRCLSVFRDYANCPGTDRQEEFSKDGAGSRQPDKSRQVYRSEEAVREPLILEGYEEESGRIYEQLERFEEYLSLAQEQALSEKEKTKKIVTDISHQLKTPVAALDTCFTILEDKELGEEERGEFYQRCRDELDGLKMLLESMIQISRMESGMIQIKRKKAPLMDTVIQAVNRIYPKASEKQMELVFDCEPQMEDSEILQDSKWLCEALMNVLDNAVKYSPCGSEIFIRIQKGISFAKIEIQDQGIGIRKKEFHKVFQRFYRGSSRQVQQAEGAGVGLYLAKQIISGHHGMISVKAGNGKKEGSAGSVFVIRLPFM